MNEKLHDNESLIKSAKVLEMLTVAHEYCVFTEKINGYKLEEIMIYYSRLMPLLYLKGSLLPDLSPDDIEPGLRFITEEEWIVIYKAAKEKFGELNKCSDTDSITPEDTEIVHHELSEIIADIYQDLKDFVLLFQKDGFTPKEQAVLSCRNLFKSNWGKKTIILLKVMHFNVYGNDNNL